MSVNMKFKLRPALPGVATLNKKIIALAVIIVVVILTIVFISALMPKRTASSTATTLTATDNITGPINSSVKQLPGYSDFAQINKLLARNQQQQTDPETPALRKQLAAMQQTQKALEQQLQALKQHPQQVVTANELPPAQQQANNSAIFFSGGAPDTGAENKLVTKQIASQQKMTTSATENGAQPPGKSVNSQQNKLNFLSKDNQKSKTFSEHVLQPLRSPYELLQGTFIPAVLITATNSDVPGAVKAQVRQNVYDSVTGIHLLIPQGSLLMGEYNSNVAYGQTRVQMVFTRLIRPDGSSIQLSNPQGMEDTGVNGLTGDVNNHWGRIIASAFLVSAFSIPAVVMSNNNGNWNGGNVAAYSMMNGVSQLGNQIVSKNLAVQPTIKLSPGKMLTIMVNKDMIIPPFKGKNV